MGSLGFTLADRLGAKSVPCSVKGCSRTWLQMTGKGVKLGGRTAGDERDPASKMCEACADKFRTLVDVEMPCDRPGCEVTWTWPVQAQLEAFATRRPAPQHLCAADEAKLAALTDREIPCSVEGCTRHSIFTRRAQLLAGAPDVEPPAPVVMCGPCSNVYDKIADRPVTCGIRGCKRKWSWTRDEQIQDYAAGESNQPPRRLCETCKGTFGAITNREVRCRTSGCKNTWTWLRELQLDAAVADKPLPKAPHRMCQRCIDLYSGLKDVERPCRRPGCKRTWTDKRGAQLARAVRGKTGDPYPHYCIECEKELGELEERHVPCRTEHCPGTWIWTAAQQLAAGVRPVPKLDAEAEGHSRAHRVEASDRVKADRVKLNGRGVAATNGDPEARDQAAASAVDALDAADATEADATPDLEETAADATSSDDAELSAAATSVSEPEPSHAPSDHAAAAHASAESVRSPRKRRHRKRRREIRPPDRRCDDCLAFLTDRKTKEIPCSGCKTAIHWPPESQLQTHLGNWAEPTLCGACKRDLTEAARAAEREALRHGGHLVPATSEAATAAPGPDALALAGHHVGGGNDDEPQPPATAPEVPSPSVNGTDAQP